MPYTYEIDAGRQLVACRAWGDLTDDDVRRLYAKLMADPKFHPTFRQLTDLRETTDLSITPRFVVSLAQERYFAPGAKRAYVAEADFQYGSAKMFAALAEMSGQRVSVFRTMEEAERWLGEPRVRLGSRPAE